MAFSTDKRLWRYGSKVASSLGRGVAWELDFLRGMHQGNALRYLARELSSATGRAIHLTSIWLDKHAWVSWSQGGNRVDKRELADLAVIVRRRHQRKVVSWMWLIQGKRTSKLLDTYTGSSTPFELDLLHRMPMFSLNGVKGAFRLKNDFPPSGCTAISPQWPIAVSTPWTFMDFRADSAKHWSANSQTYSPIAPRWPGSNPPLGAWAKKWQTINSSPQISLSSYTECLSAIIKCAPHPWTSPMLPGTSWPHFVPGAPIDPDTFPEWSALYDELIAGAQGKAIGHAATNSNPLGSLLQLSQVLQNWYLHKALLTAMPSPSSRYTFGQHGWDWAAATAGFGQRPGSSIEDLIEFHHRIAEQKTTRSPSEPNRPREPAFENDEPGGMLTLFVDVLGEAEIHRG